MWFSDRVRKETNETEDWSLRQWLAIVGRGGVDLRRALLHCSFSRSGIKTHMGGRHMQSPIKGSVTEVPLYRSALFHRRRSRQIQPFNFLSSSRVFDRI
ncbi:unnamed protein product [Lactuca virosa]|uniref:Uncharacterized protein n=1 Tax=Lactuca virosa TaxID=75947 RepID=A0AAU9PNA7_9ASTR|nr:unnamed protein product [Lactuca virosa]